MNMTNMEKLENINYFYQAESQRRCVQYRRKILDISQQVSALHAAGAMCGQSSRKDEKETNN